MPLLEKDVDKSRLIAECEACLRLFWSTKRLVDFSDAIQSGNPVIRATFASTSRYPRQISELIQPNHMIKGWPFGVFISDLIKIADSSTFIKVSNACMASIPPEASWLNRSQLAIQRKRDKDAIGQLKHGEQLLGETLYGRVSTITILYQ